jgi:squalene synthase HpnC
MAPENTTATASRPTLPQAYAHCREMAHSHYENFPVASLLLPPAMREPVSVVYAFARTADDLADEGEADEAARLAALEQFGQWLDASARGEPPPDPVFIALADVLERRGLPVSLCHDLLSAFRQDVTTRRYATFEDVLDYCRRSADPVGRLLLHLHGSASDTNLTRSDRICTALQLINFWQDLTQDFEENDRIYVPLEDMRRFGVTEEHFRQRRSDSAMVALMRFQWRRAREIMLSGAPLARDITGRFGLELRLIVEGGLRVLDRLEAGSGDVFARPRLRRSDLLVMFWRALFLRRPPSPYNGANFEDAGRDDA